MAAKKSSHIRKQKLSKQRRQARRDEIFPPRTMTAREQGAMMASRVRPKTDWRTQLQSRFDINGDLTPCQLDDFNPGEPDRYDYTDIQEAHALAHVPLWKIDASQVKLLFDYGYSTNSVFRLGLLIAEEDPFLSVEGSVFGELTPSLAGQAKCEYNPITDIVSYASEEMEFRADSVKTLLQNAEEMLTAPGRRSKQVEDGDLDADIAILNEAKDIAAGPRRLAMTEAEAKVADRRRGGQRLVPASGCEDGVLVPPADIEADIGGNRIRKKKITFYIIGIGSKPVYAFAFDSSLNPVQCDAYFGQLDLAASKAGMKTLYEIPVQPWIDFT